MSLRFSIALVLLASFAAGRAVGAQRTNGFAIGIRPTPRQSVKNPSLGLQSRVSEDESSAGLYVVLGALVGGGVAGLWEARAVSRNGNDFAGTGGLLWVPVAAGAVLGAFGGWLIYKIVHSTSPAA